MSNEDLTIQRELGELRLLVDNALHKAKLIKRLDPNAVNDFALHVVRSQVRELTDLLQGPGGKG